MEHSHDTDVRDMLDMVSERVSDRESQTGLKQQCTIEVYVDHIVNDYNLFISSPEVLPRNCIFIQA